MNNFYYYQRDGNLSSGRGDGGGGGGSNGPNLENPWLNPSAGSNSTSGGHPINGARAPSPQPGAPHPAWRLMRMNNNSNNNSSSGGGGSNNNNNNMSSQGFGNQSRMAAGRERYGNSEMLMALKKGFKDRGVVQVSERDQQTGGIFDPSEFPSLGGSGEVNTGLPSANGIGGYSDLYRSGAGEYSSNFSNKNSELSSNLELRVHPDEFPALSANGSNAGRSNLGGAPRVYDSGSYAEELEPRMYGNDSASSEWLGSSYGEALNKSLARNAPQRTSTPSQEAGSNSGQIGDSKSGDVETYGLKGLSRIMASSANNADLVLLSHGIDPTTLTMDSSTSVLDNFRSPFGDRGPAKPDSRIPDCYYMQTPHLQAAHFAEFQVETLFYIFYSMPRDLLQIFAALQLHNRDWRSVAGCEMDDVTRVVFSGRRGLAGLRSHRRPRVLLHRTGITRN